MTEDTKMLPDVQPNVAPGVLPGFLPGDARDGALMILRSGVVPERYERSALAYPDLPGAPVEAQARLLKSRVAVIGCGGLGGHVIELLARSGVGFLRVVDGDIFVLSNLNRQCLCTEINIGQPKALAACERVAVINSAVVVEAVTQFATPENLPGLLEGIDLVVDALDNLEGRKLLAGAAARLNIPMVHGAVSGFLGHATVLYPGDPWLESIYPEQTTQADRSASGLPFTRSFTADDNRFDGPEPGSRNTQTPERDSGCNHKPANAVSAPREDVGVASPVPAVVAAVQAAETLKLLLGAHKSVLRGKLFICDLGMAYTQVVDLRQPAR